MKTYNTFPNMEQPQAQKQIELGNVAFDVNDSQLNFKDKRHVVT